MVTRFTIEDDTYDCGSFGFYSYSQETVRFTDFNYRGAPLRVNETETLAFQFTATDAETPNNLTFSIDRASLNLGMQIDPSTGLFSWTPNATQSGEYTVTITVADPQGASATDTFRVIVIEPQADQSPFIAPDTGQTDQTTAITIPVLQNDGDPDDNIAFVAGLS